MQTVPDLEAYIKSEVVRTVAAIPRGVDQQAIVNATIAEVMRRLGGTATDPVVPDPVEVLGDFKIYSTLNYKGQPDLSPLGMTRLPVVYEQTFYPELPLPADWKNRAVPTDAGINAALSQSDVVASDGMLWIDIELQNQPQFPWAHDEKVRDTLEIFARTAQAIKRHTDRPIGFYGIAPNGSILSAGRQQESLKNADGRFTHSFEEWKSHNDYLLPFIEHVDFLSPRCYVTYSHFPEYHFDAWLAIAEESKRLAPNKPCYAVISPRVGDPGSRPPTFRKLTTEELLRILRFMRANFDGVIFWGGYDLNNEEIDGDIQLTWDDSLPFIAAVETFVAELAN